MNSNREEDGNLPRHRKGALALLQDKKEARTEQKIVITFLQINKIF